MTNTTNLRTAVAFAQHSIPSLLKWSICLFVCGSCLLNTGCAWLRNAFYRGATPPQVFASDVTKEQIIQAVNANSKAIQSMQAKVHVRATGTPTLSGDLSVEQPSRMRMQVGLLNMTSSGIDIGSNEEEFWVWLKTPMPGQPPAVLFARHDLYENSQAKQMLPIEPAWVIDSLGLAYFDPTAEHTGPFQRPDGNLEIQSRFQTKSGVMIKSIIVDPQSSVVVAQEINKNGVKIASSTASKHQYFKEIGASIPRMVEIEVGTNTPQPGKVVIELSNILPNSIDETYAGMWQMPRPQNISMIDIAQQTQAIPNTNPNSVADSAPFQQGRFASGNTSNGPLNANPLTGQINPDVSPQLNYYQDLAQSNPAADSNAQPRAFQQNTPRNPAQQPGSSRAPNAWPANNTSAIPNPYSNSIQNASFNAESSRVDENQRLPIRGFNLNRSNQ